MTEQQATWISEEQQSGQLDIFDQPRQAEPPPPSRPAVFIRDGKLATKLAKLADGMQAAIDGKMADRQQNTPKRMAQAAHARLEGLRLKRTQQALRGLSGLHKAGGCPGILTGIRSKKAAYDLLGAELDMVGNGFHQYHVDMGKPRQGATAEALALWNLCAERTPEEQAREELDQMERDLTFNQIPGYFPTPAGVVSTMLEHAGIESGMSVLEPSAGNGAILDQLHRTHGIQGGAYEINHTLREILKAKGYCVLGHDFLDPDTRKDWDRILMNPPFERMADIDHVQMAYSVLAEGGRLVSVMSPGPFFRSDGKAQAFREWLEQTGAPWEVFDLPAGSFKASGTGVAAKLIIIDKE